MLFHKVVRFLCLWMKSHDVDIQMIAIAQCFPVMPLVAMQKVEAKGYKIRTNGNIRGNANAQMMEAGLCATYWFL